MANNGAFNTSDYEGRFLIFSWSLTSQRPENNTSTISWSLTGAGQAEASYYNAGNFKITINETVVYQSATRIRLYNGTVVASGSVTIPHYPDGQKEFTASAEAGIYTVEVNCRGNSSFVLPPITRYASILSASNFTDEGSPSLEFSNPTNAKLQFKIMVNNTDVVVRNNVSDAVSPYVFTLTTAEREALRALCPTSNTLAVKYSLGTYQGATPANWQYSEKTMSIVNASPVVSVPTYKDNNPVSVAISQSDQVIIQNQSLLQILISSISAQKSATLVSAEVVVNQASEAVTLSGTTASNTIINFGVVNVASDIDAQVIITDSRGNKTSYDLALDIEAWSLPSALITCERENGFDSQVDLTVNADYASLDGKNSITIHYDYKLTTSSSWTTGANISSGVMHMIYLDNTKEWNMRVILTDVFGSTTYYTNLSIGLPLVFFDRLKRSVGFNCFPSSEGSVESCGLILDDLIHIGSQELYAPIVAQVDGQGDQLLLTDEGFNMISGLFEGITIPSSYERAYRITAQLATTSSNKGSVRLNNIRSSEVSTGSSTTRRMVSTDIFTEDDITLDSNNLNLYASNDSAGLTMIFSITLQGYLKKS